MTDTELLDHLGGRVTRAIEELSVTQENTTTESRRWNRLAGQINGLMLVQYWLNTYERTTP